MTAHQAYIEAIQKLQAAAWEEIAKIERPITLTLKPGIEVTPALQEWMNQCELIMREQVRDPNSELNKLIAEQYWKEFCHGV